MQMREKILEACRDRGITQRVLAAKVGVSTTQVGKWVGGQGRPYWDQLRDVALALDVPIDWLVDETDVVVPPRGTRRQVLTAQESVLLAQVREMGVDEAARRLIHPTVAASPEFPAIRK